MGGRSGWSCIATLLPFFMSVSLSYFACTILRVAVVTKVPYSVQRVYFVNGW